MNLFIIEGRMTRDAELKFTTGGKAICTFDVAVNRKFKNAEGKYPVDFFSVTVWGKYGEVLSNHLQKGGQVWVKGELQTRTYEKDGVKKLAIEIVADEVIMGRSKGEMASGFEPVGIDDDTPF